uniref:Vitelline membrane outer layer 1 homolog b n=1 Tax=Oreochromis niloticus TaxID=8128 RepID=A0A669EDW4_ORENI
MLRLSLSTTCLLLLSWVHVVPGQLSVSYGMPWGNWGSTEMCPVGSYAVGFSIKVETFQGSGDDTAVNGIRLYCFDPSSKRRTTVESAVGSWGDWTAVKSCASGYLDSFMLRVESFQIGDDDTSVNNIKFTCSGTGAQLVGDGMPWGEWGHWSRKCPKGVICGLRTRVEASQGSGDDTAVNGIRLYCFDPSSKRRTTVQSAVGSWGDWTAVKSCASGYLDSFMLRVESSQGEGDDTSVNNIKFTCSGTGAQLVGDGMPWGGWRLRRALETTRLLTGYACTVLTPAANGGPRCNLLWGDSSAAAPALSWRVMGCSGASGDTGAGSVPKALSVG